MFGSEGHGDEHGTGEEPRESHILINLQERNLQDTAHMIAVNRNEIDRHDIRVKRRKNQFARTVHRSHWSSLQSNSFLD